MHFTVPVAYGCLQAAVSAAIACKIWQILRGKGTLIREQESRIDFQADEIALMSQAWRIEWDDVEMRQELGRGAYGAVYRATLKEEFTVAVKVMLDTQSVDIESDPEICFLKRARHRQIVMFLGCGRMDDGNLFLVLEFCDAGALSNWFYSDQPRHPWRRRLGLLSDAAQGVAYLHTVHDALHRDLKGENILLLTVDGRIRAKLADFGTTRIRQRARNYTCAVPSTERRFSAAASFKADTSGEMEDRQLMTSATGTPNFMAPELLRDMASEFIEYGKPADVYSFGMVLYECVEGDVPWHHLNSNWIHVLVNAVLSGKTPRVSREHAKGAPEGFMECMRDCLAQLPDDRPDITAVLERLEGLQSRFSRCHQVMNPSFPSRPSRQRQSSMPDAVHERIGSRSPLVRSRRAQTENSVLRLELTQPLLAGRV